MEGTLLLGLARTDRAAVKPAGLGPAAVMLSSPRTSPSRDGDHDPQWSARRCVFSSRARSVQKTLTRPAPASWSTSQLLARTRPGDQEAALSRERFLETQISRDTTTIKGFRSSMDPCRPVMCRASSLEACNRIASGSESWQARSRQPWSASHPASIGSRPATWGPRRDHQDLLPPARRNGPANAQAR
jgi:hypothetical protein